MKVNRNHGFTLIELLIGIAIIGILAAIALPQYQSYTGRAQAVEGIKLTSGLRDDIAAIVADTNAYPTAFDVSKLGQIGSSAEKLDGKYVEKGGVSVAAGTGVITVKYDAGVVSGGTLVMEPTMNLSNKTQLIKWTCKGTLNKQYLPTSCQM